MKDNLQTNNTMELSVFQYKIIVKKINIFSLHWAIHLLISFVYYNPSGSNLTS